MSHFFLRKAVIFLLLAAFLLGACRRSSPAPTPEVAATNTPRPRPSATSTATITITPTQTQTSSPTPTFTPAAHGPSGFPPNVNPLTGLFVSDPSILERNPVMVKVTNFPRNARPHAGLSYADMVFEYTIGEGGTRFTAVYYGQNVPQAGPVRSARLIDASLGSAFQGVLAFASADPFVFGRIVDALGERAITEGPGTCPALCRTGSGDVNSVFVDTELLTKFATENRKIPAQRPFLEGMLFDPQAPEAGSQAGTWLQVRYSSAAISEWRFDQESGTYLRWIEDEDADGNIEVVELVDRLTEKQLGFANVVVLFAQHTELKPTLHEIEILGNTAGRPAILFRDGQAYQVFWRAVGNQPLQFYYLDGSPVPFKPGSTWFEVVGISSQADPIGTGQWQVLFRMP